MTMPMIAPNNTETNKTEYTKKAPVYNAITPNSFISPIPMPLCVNAAKIKRTTTKSNAIPSEYNSNRKSPPKFTYSKIYTISRMHHSCKEHPFGIIFIL